MKVTIVIGIIVCFYQNTIGQDFAWAVEFEGGVSRVNTITTDQSGNLYSAVTYFGDVDFDPGISENILTGSVEGGTGIQKIDSHGDFVWMKAFEGSGTDGVIGNGMEIKSMTTDSNDNLYVVGSFTESLDFDPNSGIEIVEANAKDIFILKLNAVGDLIWFRTTGAECQDSANDIVIDGDGNLCITGSFCLTVDFDFGVGVNELTGMPDGEEVFILKLTPNGDFIWSKSIASVGADRANSIISDSENNLYIGGRYTVSADFDGNPITPPIEVGLAADAFLLKLNPMGNFVWVKTIPEGISTNITSIDLDTEDNIYAVGTFIGDEIDFNNSAGTSNLSSNGSLDIFLLKLSNTGEFFWVKQFGSAEYEANASVEISDINTIYISGIYNDELDADPGEEEFILPYLGVPGSKADFFLTVLDQNGEFIKASGFTSEVGAICSTLEKGIDGGIYMAGVFSSTIDLNPSETETYFVGEETAVSSGYILKLQDGTVGISQQKELVETNLYPNPTQDNFQVKLDQIYNSVVIEITDYLGKTINQNVFLNTSLIEMELTGPVGIYFVKISTPIGQVVRKVIKN